MIALKSTRPTTRFLTRTCLIVCIALASAPSHAFQQNDDKCLAALKSAQALNLNGVTIEDRCNSSDINFRVYWGVPDVAFDSQASKQLQDICEANGGHLRSEPAKTVGSWRTSAVNCKVY